MKVYISVNELDVRAESGMNLTVVRSADKEWYSSGDITPEPDYKYMYTVEKPGVQRVYFENILSQSEELHGEPVYRSGAFCNHGAYVHLLEYP